jgi:hypothetical protein
MKPALRRFYIFSLYVTCTDIASMLRRCIQFCRLLFVMLCALLQLNNRTPHKAVFLQMQVNWPSTKVRRAMSLLVKYSQNRKSSFSATLRVLSMLFERLQSARKLTNAQKTIVT